jgi:hypothetical protein
MTATGRVLDPSGRAPVPPGRVLDPSSCVPVPPGWALDPPERRAAR